MINMIWAMDENNLVGKNNKIPWHIKEDLLYYKEKTNGQTVIMGDATYYSLKGYYKTRPLPYGKIYVASLDPSFKADDAILVPNLKEFIENVEEDIWVCGGATIYKICLPYANRLYISFVKGKYEGDAYFPQIDYSKYNLIFERDSEQVRYTIFERK